MAGKMSNRDRIAQKAAEAAETERQKGEAKDAKAAAKPEKAKAKAKARTKAKSGSARSSGRIRIVWCVCGPTGAEIKNYPYAQESVARAEAEQLTASSGKTHFVRRGELPLSD